jgi:hypothetical protein
VSEPERVADFVERDPTEILGVVWVFPEAWWEIGTHDDVRTLMVATDRVATEDHAARGRDVVNDDVRGLPLLPSCISESDQSVEAVA